MELMSLLALIIAITIGVVLKVNIGVVSIGLTMLLAIMGNLTTNDIIAGFPTNLFLNLLGMFFFFSIVQVNGSLALLSKKNFPKAGKSKEIISVDGIFT